MRYPLGVEEQGASPCAPHGGMMRELSLFTGIGGGLLGTHLLGWTPIGYVEINDYCQRVIAQRIKDGILPAAPIFTDVREFVQSGCADAYRGFVDVVTGGFPCQPFSVAGKRKGADDERNMWPATMEVIRRVQPTWAFLENVPGLLSSGYFGTILGDLSQSGFDVGWRILSAAEVGAPHRRNRLWIAAYANSKRCGDTPERRDPVRFPCGGNTQDGRFWLSKPDVGRLVDGIPDRVDRLRGIGNGQVPRVVAAAWNLLTQG